MNSTSAKMGHREIASSDLLLQTNFSPINTPPTISARQSKKNKPGTESTTKSPPNSSKVQHVPCKFFKNGACTAGKNCVFSHSKEVQPSAALCKYYLKGNCKFGAKCALQHGNEKKSGSRSFKLKSQANHLSADLSRLEQRSPLEFGDEMDFLSRSLSRANLEAGYGAFVHPSGNNLTFYTPQPKTSQLTSIFASPDPNQFSMSLPGMQPYPAEDKFPTASSLFAPGPGGPSSFTDRVPDRVRGADFISSNFTFGFSDEHDLLPSSLDELLTPTELQMRRTKASMLSRPGFRVSSQAQASPGLSPTANKALRDFDGGHLGNYEAHSHSLGQSFNSDDIHVEGSEQAEDLKDDFNYPTNLKKGDGASVSTGVDDDIPFHMDGDF
ncbi:hypothetical protein L0F63_002750 [Massospora cicadina]|nr:hypothetical protein L0F63_002750 [Massospora cicadina]